MNSIFFRKEAASFIRHIKSLFAVLSILLIASCGGGTSGTGPATTPSRTIQGLVVDGANLPIFEAIVEDLEGGEQAQTDEKGAFTLGAELDRQTLHLAVKTESFEGTTSLEIDQDAPDNLMVKIIVNEVTGIVSSVLIEQAQESDLLVDTSKAKTQVFKGRVLNSKLSPVAGVTIKVQGSSTVLKTDKNGKFVYQSHKHVNQINFLITHRGLPGSFSIKNVPQNVQSVSFTVYLSIDYASTDPGSGEGVEERLVVEVGELKFEQTR
jgi:hypothetical protein